MAIPDCLQAKTRERDLVERAKRDPRAFAVLYRQHYAAIAGYIFRRTGDATVTDDLTADTFMTAMRALPRFRHRGVPIRSWLYRIATTSIHRWLRKSQSRVVFSDPGQLASAGPPAVTAAEDPEASLATARTALMSLKPKHQAVLALHYLEGMSVEEVAAVIGCRVGTVKSRLSRAREALRERLTRGR